MARAGCTKESNELHAQNTFMIATDQSPFVRLAALHCFACTVHVQEAADMADKDDMRRLAAELHEFNRLRQSELSERDRRERCAYSEILAASEP